MSSEDPSTTIVASEDEKSVDGKSADETEDRIAKHQRPRDASMS